MLKHDQIQKDELLKFITRNKFSIKAWNERGLNPSSDEISAILNDLFNSCANQLIIAIDNKASKKQLQRILKSNLSLLNKMDYDTEESEFICSVFEEISANANIDFSKDLNNWLHGYLSTRLSKIRNIFLSNKSIKTLMQPCNTCGTDLESHIIKTEPEIPETDWLLVKCNNCGECNLLSVGSGVKELKFGNYQWIENVRIRDFTYEQAIERVNQINLKKDKS
jgi:hypothetical protein